jgi:TonB family protein
VPDAPKPVVRHPREAAPDIETKPDGEITSSKKPTPAAEKAKPKLDLKLVKRDNSKQKAEEAKRIAEQKYAEARADQMARVNATFDKAVSGITSDLSPGLTISSSPGFGGGGEATVNYGQAILGLYNNAWNPPPDIQDDSAVVGTRIVIAASGKVISADIIKRSGTPALDRSVQRALDAVRRVPPFPEGAKDLERTFKIEFNLKAKRALG